MTRPVLGLLTTRRSQPCPRCSAEVPPRARRIVEDIWPLCEDCLADAGLTAVDELLAAVVELERNLGHLSPAAALMASRITAAGWRVAEDRLADRTWQPRNRQEPRR